MRGGINQLPGCFAAAKGLPSIVIMYQLPSDKLKQPWNITSSLGKYG